jgi:hypothetical protein
MKIARNTFEFHYNGEIDCENVWKCVNAINNKEKLKSTIMWCYLFLQATLMSPRDKKRSKINCGVLLKLGQIISTLWIFGFYF